MSRSEYNTNTGPFIALTQHYIVIHILLSLKRARLFKRAICDSGYFSSLNIHLIADTTSHTMKRTAQNIIIIRLAPHNAEFRFKLIYFLLHQYILYN